MVYNPHPFISIIVLNWNGKRFLPRCLEAIASQTFQDFEVLLLDNASTDGSAEGTETRWPGYRVVRFEQNLGFSAANNRGAEQAQGEWLAFLNNDAFAEPNWLAAMVRAIQANPQYAFFSSLLTYADQPGWVQSSGDILNFSGFAWPRDNHLPLTEAHQEPGEVFSPCAAAAVYRRDVFIQAGGFDEAFFSHLEDVDLGFRLRLAGYRCLFVPGAVVHHIGSASYGPETDQTVYQVQRNVVWAFLTDMPGMLLWKYLPLHILANLVFLVYYSLRGQAKPVWKAKRDALLSPSFIRSRRKRIQAACQVEPSQIDCFLDHQLSGPYVLGRRARISQRSIISKADRPGSDH
jgi:GT2 family glycosyltransferase